jgi:hypothetical protein
MQIRFASLAVLLTSASLALAQGGASRGSASATIGGKKVTIDYGRPSLKGRSFADLTKDLPSDRVWRAGMNQVTTLSTETALTVGGKKVAPGKYSVYVHVPTSGDWSLILNSDLGVPLGQIYDQAPPNMKNEPWPYMEDYTAKIGTKEAVRVAMKKSAGKSEEMLTYTLTPSGNGATLTIAWGDQAWSTDLQAAK